MSMEGTILFAVVGRTQYGFDIYSVDVPASFDSLRGETVPLTENLLTDGVSVNFNGSFARSEDGREKLLYVSERTGSPQLYINSEKRTPEMGPLHGFPIGEDLGDDGPSGLFFDKPSMHKDKVFFVSTQRGLDRPRECNTAVYSSCLTMGRTIRLTPKGVADFSPSLSPSGKWITVASYEGRGWQGDIHDLHTSIFVFNAEDGSQRRLVAKNGGWPTWADDDTIYFHRKSEDGWWSVYKVSNWAEAGDVVEAQRVTPPCVHAFTPACPTTPAQNWIAVATRRLDSKWRHIEIFDMASGEFIPVTEKLHPERHHYNPFVAAGSRRLGYHRCRDLGAVQDGEDGALFSLRIPRLEAMECPVKSLSLVRMEGFFPSVSPCGRFIAYNRSLAAPLTFSLNIMRRDGSKSWLITEENFFSSVWDPQREGIIYGSMGAIFAPPSASVQLAALHVPMDALTDDVDRVDCKLKVLTRPNTGNNAFPALSPDGKWLVFRSGRAGGEGKNLYIMSAEHGEDAEVRRLTCGEWTDTMPCWSPDGQWIAFSSNMHGVDEGSFGLYMVHPDGTSLHRIQPRSHGVTSSDQNGVHEVVHGRINHVKFSQDGRSIVFTSDLAGISAEPISLPNQFQPYGEIFVSRVDGSELVRLTHNAYEDGTPAWAAVSIKLPPQPQAEGPPLFASSGSEPLTGAFMEPQFLSQVSEEMKFACCVPRQ